jgi:hypothetical protein
MSIADAISIAVEALDPTPDPWLEDPVGWTTQRRGAHVWSKQAEVMQSVVDYRFTAVRSAHGTGKSWTAGDLICWWIDVHPPGEAFVVSSAPTGAQVDAILWREITSAHARMELPGHIAHGGYPKWMIGKEIVGYGRKPTDYADPNKAMQSFQGIHAKYVLVVLDEACGIPKWLWDATDTLVTNDYSRVLAIGNPDDPASHFEVVSRPGSGWNSISISAFDLPWATGEEVPAYLHDVLTGEQWVHERKQRWGLGSPLYTSKVLGEFPEVADDTLISPAQIRIAHEREVAGIETGTYGGDVARHGPDETVVYRNRGGEFRRVYTASKQNTMRTAGAFAQIIRKDGNAVPFTMDLIGIGAGVYDRLKEQGLNVVGFDAGGQAYDMTRFINRRAEAYWGLREMFELQEADLDPQDDELASQLQSIKWFLDSRGRIGIESKKDMKKRGLPSPDRADAVMMSAVNPIEFPDPDDIKTEPGITDDLMERSF